MICLVSLWRIGMICALVINLLTLNEVFRHNYTKDTVIRRSSVISHVFIWLTILFSIWQLGMFNGVIFIHFLKKVVIPILIVIGVAYVWGVLIPRWIYEIKMALKGISKDK